MYNRQTLLSYVHHQLSVRLDAVLISGKLCPGRFSVQEIMVLWGKDGYKIVVIWGING